MFYVLVRHRPKTVATSLLCEQHCKILYMQDLAQLYCVYTVKRIRACIYQSPQSQKSYLTGQKFSE